MALPTNLNRFGGIKGSSGPYSRELEYIEATGTQYIDTGVYITGATITTEITVMPKSQGAVRYMFGGRRAAGSKNYMCAVNSSNRIGYKVGSGSVVYFSGYNELNTIHTYKLDNGIFYRDGVVIDSSCEGLTFTQDYKLPLLTIISGGTYSTSNTFIGNLYACKMWDSGTLIRDFIPVLDNNMVACLYDKVNGNLYYNKGTGDFTAGRQIHLVNYLQSDGTQYIDTKYIVTSLGTRMIIDACFTDLSPSEQEMGRTWSNDGGFAIGYAKNASTTKFLCQAGHTLIYAGTLDTDRHTFDLEIDANSLATFKVDNDTASDTVTFADNGATLLLFARHGTSGTLIQNKNSAKLYSAKILFGGNVVKNYVPAIDENNVGFLFETLTHSAYSNAGSGNFLYG